MPNKPAVTVGMAVLNDPDGVFFTVQSLRLHHAEMMRHAEIVVIDNAPDTDAGARTKKFLSKVPNARYVPFSDWQGTTVKGKIFDHAKADVVVCIDSHVLLAPDALQRVTEYLYPPSMRHVLVHGPLLLDDLQGFETHMEPKWRGQMFGTWARDERGADPNGPAFDIPMHGMGAFAIRRESWPGFNPAFRGFGVEEGYIHDKMRRNFGRVVCLPAFRWSHRFADKPSYRITLAEKFRNYVIAWDEIGKPVSEVIDHFSQFGPKAAWIQQAEDVLGKHVQMTTVTPVADNPLVSCIMPTYNRTPILVEEAVQCFLDQMYKRKELIVLNDHPQQKYVFNHPDVKVINVPTRFATLGQKLNAAIAASTGDLICRWDDDDIHLPWRLTRSVREISQSGHHYWRDKGYWWNRNGTVTFKDDNACPSKCIFTRVAWSDNNGFASINSGQDVDFELRLNDYRMFDGPTSTPGTAFYIYRWSTGEPHLSSFGVDTPGQLGGYDRLGAAPPRWTGYHLIRPKLIENYVATTRQLALELHKETADVA